MKNLIEIGLRIQFPKLKTTNPKHNWGMTNDTEFQEFDGVSRCL